MIYAFHEKKRKKERKRKEKNPRYRPGEYKRVLEQKITGEEEGKKVMLTRKEGLFNLFMKIKIQDEKENRIDIYR